SGRGARRDVEVAGVPCGAAPPLSSRHRRTRAASSLPMMIRASEPPIKERRVLLGFIHTSDLMASSDSKNGVSFRETNGLYGPTSIIWAKGVKASRQEWRARG